jgi:DUF4097 and DUF4098 domain-containing protein YvlB
MPSFDTSGPITVTIDLVVGDVRITAGDRGDTTVEIHPSDASAEVDVRAATQTRVEYADGNLLVKAPRQRGLGLFGKAGSVDVTVAVPAGSQLRADTSMAAFHSTGRLGDCRITTAAGDIHLDHTGALDLNTAAGAITVDRVIGPAELRTGSGRIRLQNVDGTAVIKNSNGDTSVGTVAGDLRANAANGDITVDHPAADVVAATSNGDVRIGEVRRGSVSIKSALGELEVGIAAGTAALLDVHTQYGRVRNRLDACDGPTADAETVEVRARTSYGDIVIHRS